MFNSLIFLLLFSSSLFAKTWTVTNEGELQNALDSLLSGDEVLLEDGVYHGSFLIENKDLEETVIIRARNPHGAILTGATPLVATWEDLGDNIYKTKSPYNTWQLFRNFQQSKIFFLLLFFIQILYALDLWNRLELDAHIFIQGRC